MFEDLDTDFSGLLLENLKFYQNFNRNIYSKSEINLEI